MVVSVAGCPDVSPARGEIWLVDLGFPVGHESALRRPALVISPDRFARTGLVTVLPLTTARREYPTRIPIDVPGSSDVSYVQVEQIRTVSVSRLQGPALGSADPLVLRQVDEVLRLFLDLPRD